jgi:hypothetical protein
MADPNAERLASNAAAGQLQLQLQQLKQLCEAVFLAARLPHACFTQPPQWPKTSLAAVRDGHRLSPEQFERLHALCK